MERKIIAAKASNLDKEDVELLKLCVPGAPERNACYNIYFSRTSEEIGRIRVGNQAIYIVDMLN